MKVVFQTEPGAANAVTLTTNDWQGMHLPRVGDHVFLTTKQGEATFEVLRATMLPWTTGKSVYIAEVHFIVGRGRPGHQVY